MIVLGLTGSVGMGKTYVADRFREFDVPVFDADRCAHELLNRPLVIEEIKSMAPDAVTSEGVDRGLLGETVFHDEEAMHQLEEILHPLIKKEIHRFVQKHSIKKHPLVVLDIPLLFEKGFDDLCNRVMVVTVPEEIQKERVMARLGMTEEKFKAILASQWPNEKKAKKADAVINTNVTKSKVIEQMKNVIESLTEKAL